MISDNYEVVIVLWNIYIYIYYPGNLWPSITYIPMTKHQSDVVRRGAWWVAPCWHRRTPQRLPDRPCQGFPILDGNQYHDIHVHTYTNTYIYIYRAMLGRSGLYNKYIIAYVYIYNYMYVCMYVFMYVCMYACMYVSMCIYIYRLWNILWNCWYIYIHIYIYMYKHMFNMTIPNILS